jgi:hypothetical protein
LKDHKSGLFWITFSDVLLSLFFVILILFIFTFFKLKEQNASLVKRVEKLLFLEQVEENMKLLGDGGIFEYNENLKKYILKEKVNFAISSTQIPKSSEYNLLIAGKKIQSIIKTLKSNAISNKQNVKYLLIIEGMASKDNFKKNFELSYGRAKAVFDFWEASDIDFDPTVVEILISGSGTIGSARSNQESQNQSIMVQVVPKNMPDWK